MVKYNQRILNPLNGRVFLIMPESFGSFGAISPDNMQAVKNALARRQGGEGGTSPLSTQSAASPSASVPAPQPTGGTPAGGLPAPTQTQPAPKPTEAEIILKALSSRLSSDSKLKEARIPQTV